jgi:hypothetical protein
MWRQWIEIGVLGRWELVELVELVSALIKDLAESGPLILVDLSALRRTLTFMISDALTSLDTFVEPNLTPLLSR